MKKRFVASMFLVMLCLGSTAYGKEKEPVFAGCMSALVPGLGQIYNGQVFKGFLMFGTALAGSIVASLPETELKFNIFGDPYYETTYPNAWMWILVLAEDIWSIADAVIVANKINEGKMGLELKLKGDGVQLSFNYKF